MLITIIIVGDFVTSSNCPKHLSFINRTYSLETVKFVIFDIDNALL